MKRTVAFGIIGLLFASVSYAAFYQFDERDPNYQLALSIAAAQEAQKEVDINEKIILDEDFTPQDFGLTGVGILPTSPFYFLKGIRRTIQSAITFDPAAEVELKIRFSAEKLLEAKAVAGAEGADPDDIKYALENFHGELARVNARVQDATEGLGEEKAVELTKKLMDSTIKYQKSLGKIEKTLPPTLFEDIKLAKEKTSETFGGVFDLVKPEKAVQELTAVLETQKGSEFKDFKNIEVLKEIEEKVPEQAKDAMRMAQEQALTRLQGELEKLQLAKKAIFEDFVREIGGSEAHQLEIVTELEAKPLSPEMREVLVSVKEEALSKTDKRLQTLTPGQQEKFLGHLTEGEISDIRVLKELEQNVSKGVLQGIIQAKDRAKGGIVEKVKEGEFKEEEKQKLFGELERLHDAKSLAVLDEIETLIPLDKKAFFTELKQKAVVEIKRDIDRAGTASQRQAIVNAIAGDHPEQFDAIERFQQVQTPFDVSAIWRGILKAQGDHLQTRVEFIRDGERLAHYEQEFRQRKDLVGDFDKIENVFRTQRVVFESPEKALAQIREAEGLIAELERLADNLPFEESSDGQGRFDYAIEEIERLLELAERKVDRARTAVGYGDIGRAFGLSNAASSLARDGIRLAKNYIAGRKEVRCPFIFPPPPNFCLNGNIVSDIDQNGCQLPPRCEYGAPDRCPFPPPLPYNFCAHGRIVYEKSSQGCPLPPRCEEFRECPLIIDPKPCPDGSYREGYYKDGCFVYGECRVAERQFSCGGAAGLTCPNGYRCEMPTPSYPDALGKCVSTQDKPIICQAYWQGYVFDPSTKICHQEGTSGCSDPFVYHTKEECEKGGRITICPSMPTVMECPAGQRKVVTFSSLECGMYYGCESGEPTGKPQCSDGIDNDKDGKIDYPADTSCYDGTDSDEWYPSSGNACNYNKICDSNESYTSCPGDCGSGVGTNWVEHIWKFSDGVTERSFILNRTDAEYSDYIARIHAQCLTIPKSKFAWKPNAGNDDPANWQNFGIPDCSGTAVNYVCGNRICDPGETTGSCPADCGTVSKPQCSDGIDNDSDGKIDYPADTSCYDGTDSDEWYPSSTTTTKCMQTTEATCNADAGCKWVVGFGCGVKAQCNDGIDNDADTFIDYPKDPGCIDNFDDSEIPTGTTTCTPETCYDAKYCSDGIDNDNDGLIDSKDPGCGGTSGAYCGDKICNNGETATSCAVDCGGTSTGVPSPGPSGLTFTLGSTSVTFNWIDNSIEESNQLEERAQGGTWNVVTSIGGVGGTGSISYPNRPSGTYDYQVRACNINGCSMPSNIVIVTYSGTTTPPPPPPSTTKPQCSDGVDNDNDGKIDYPSDTGCYGADDNDEAMASTATCSPETCYDAVYCTDGKDNDADGFIDSADPGCGGGSTSTCDGTADSSQANCTAISGCTWDPSGYCYTSSSGGGTTTTSCGDHICNGSETSATCPADCCASGYYWDSATNSCKVNPTTTTTTASCDGTADSSQANCTAVAGCTWDATGNYCYPTSGASLYNLFTPLLHLFGF